MGRTAKLFSSLQAFCIVMLGGAVMILLVFLGCWSNFDVNEARSFGLPAELVPQFLASYAPVVSLTVIGFRDVLFTTAVSIGEKKPQPPIRIRSGAAVLYGVGLFGILTMIVVLLIVSRGVEVTMARWLIGGAATVWAATVGTIFDRFFKTYQGEKKPDVA